MTSAGNVAHKIVIGVWIKITSQMVLEDRIEKIIDKLKSIY